MKTLHLLGHSADLSYFCAKKERILSLSSISPGACLYNNIVYNKPFPYLILVCLLLRDERLNAS